MIELKLTDAEWENLLQLVVIGEYAASQFEKKAEKFTHIAEKLYRKQYELRIKISGDEAEENEIADIREKISADIDDYLEYFENYERK